VGCEIAQPESALTEADAEHALVRAEEALRCATGQHRSATRARIEAVAGHERAAKARRSLMHARDN
jgi:hypothetical protein